MMGGSHGYKLIRGIKESPESSRHKNKGFANCMKPPITKMESCDPPQGFCIFARSGFRSGSGRILREGIKRDGGAGIRKWVRGVTWVKSAGSGWRFSYDLTTNYSEYAHPFGVARPPRRVSLGEEDFEKID